MGSTRQIFSEDRHPAQDSPGRQHQDSSDYQILVVW